MHLIIDGYGDNPRLMQDEKLIYDFLDQYPSQIEMHKIAPPSVRTYTGSKPEDWGVSGYVIIAESHISIHTFVERSLVNLDVFSCKEFDARRVVKDVQEKFSLVKLRSYLIHRGLEYSDWNASTEIAELEPLLTTAL